MSQFPFFADQEYKKRNAQNPLPKGEYDGCHFVHCDFTQTPIANYKFSDCSFSYCDLSNVSVVNTQFNQVQFSDCKILGVDFSTCDDFLFALFFEHCTLDLASFYQRRMKSGRFIDCSLKKVDFTETELQGSDFSGSDLHGALFEQTQLEKANFSSAKNLTIDPERNRLKQARFKPEHLPGLLTKYQLRIE